MGKLNKIYVEKTLNFLLNILIFIFSIILLISIYTWVQTKILRNKYADFFGYSFFEIKSASMAETIDIGDCIIVKLTKRVKLKDIITYELDGEYVTHRITEVRNGSYITRGDANNTEDDKPVSRDQVVGKVVKIIPKFGIIRKTIFNKVVLIALIITLYISNLVIKKNKEEGEYNLYKRENSPLFIEVIIKQIYLFLVKVKDFIMDKIVNPLIDKLIEKRLQAREIQKNNLSYYEKKEDLSQYKNIETENKELEKTTLYRAVAVDNNEVKENNRPVFENVLSNKPATEEELEKTALYRVISVNLSENNEKEKEIIKEEEKEPVKEEIVPNKQENEEFKITYTETEEEEEVPETINSEDDLEKTMLFRVISVDVSDKDETILEIAKNQMNKPEHVEPVKEKVKEIEEEPKEEEKEESLTDINLEFLKGKKSKNIIDAAINIIKEEVNELLNLLIEEESIYVNVPTIKKTFMDAYINARYYNNYGNDDSEGNRRVSIGKIEKVIKDVATRLVSDYRGNNNKYEYTVTTYGNAFALIARLRQAGEAISELKVRKEYFKKELIKFAKDWNNKKIEKTADAVNKTQKHYSNMLTAFLNSLETNMFNLNINKISSKKDMYGLELAHNISFSKVYSEYIIDKTYSEGIIAEDKVSVLLTLLSLQLVKDMANFDFNNKYLLYIPNTLYKKERKLDKALKMIDDEYARNNVIILVSYEELINNIGVIKGIRKLGYKFAVVFDKQYTFRKKDHGNVYVADYIFINKKAVNAAEVMSFIPSDIADKVIYDDVTNKVGDFGGE